jgi:hypothetical protein
MTDPHDEPTREDAVYARLFAFLTRYGFFIAIAAPLLLLSPFVTGGAFILLVALIWLGEAIVYASVQRRRRGVRSGADVILVVTAIVVTAGLLLLTLSRTLR